MNWGLKRTVSNKHTIENDIVNENEWMVLEIEHAPFWWDGGYGQTNVDTMFIIIISLRSMIQKKTNGYACHSDP